MVHDRANWRIAMRAYGVGVDRGRIARSPALGVPAVHAQSIMRSPNLNIQSRMPTINPTVTPRINPTIAGRPVTGTSHRRHLGAHRVDASECALFAESFVRPAATPIATAAANARRSRSRRPMAAARRQVRQATGTRTAARAATRRWPRSTRRRSPMNSWPRSTVRCRTRRPMHWRGVTASCVSQSQNFPLIGATIGLFRITDRRPVETGAPRIRRRRRRSLGAAEFPLFAAGAEGGVDRGRSRAICARQASVAAGAYAGQRRQRHHRRDRFRDRRQASGTA